MYALQLKNIEKKYENDVENTFLLKIDNLKIKKGEFFGLIGGSGCGKTTLLKIIAGLYALDDGSVFIEEKDVTKISAEKRSLGMVFQQPLLFPHMTIEQNIAFGLKIMRVSKSERIKKVKEILEIVGLKGFENRYPHQLSGGQQQRVSIARAFVCNPKILLMDEPFSALDPNLREEMRILIAKIHKKYKITIIFVTHDREEASILFERMAIMKNGNILQIGSPKEIYEKPVDVYSALFIGAKNVFKGRIENDVFIADDLKVKLLNIEKNKYNHIVLRPESLKVKKVSDKIEKENLNQVRGIIRECLFRQGFFILKVEAYSKIIEIIQKAETDVVFQIGEKVFVQYDSRKIWCI